MSYGTAAKYMKKPKTFVNKWVKRYSDVKNVGDLSDRGSVQKATKNRMILRMFEKNPRLSLRTAMRKRFCVKRV